MRSARIYFEELIKYGAPLGWVKGLTPERAALLDGPDPASVPDLPTIEGVVDDRSWLCGSADDAISYIQEVESRYPGLEEITVTAPLFSPKSVVMEQLERFAREVMPSIAPQPVATDGD